MREGCSVWGSLIFKKNGVSKAQFFLASQGRRLEAGAAKAPRGRRGQGFTVWYSVRITIRLYFSGTLPPGTGKKYGLYETLAVPKSGQKVWLGYNMCAPVTAGCPLHGSAPPRLTSSAPPEGYKCSETCSHILEVCYTLRSSRGAESSTWSLA